MNLQYLPGVLYINLDVTECSPLAGGFSAIPAVFLVPFATVAPSVCSTVRVVCPERLKPPAMQNCPLLV